MLDIRTDRTTIILENVGSDASGNNDRPRDVLARMTIAEAKAFVGRTQRAIKGAEEAFELERMTRRAKKEAKRDDLLRQLAAVEAEIAELEGGDLPPERAMERSGPMAGAGTHEHMQVQLGIERELRALPVGGPSMWSGEPVSAGAIDSAALTAAASMVPTLGTTVKVGGISPMRPAPTDDELEIPDYLRRTS